MKVLYSQLCKYLPDLKASAKEVADTFTLTGFMLDKFNEVEYMGKKDYFLDLEVRQNRGDSLGVLGLARELSAYYKIPVVPNVYKKYSSDLSYKLPITIRNSEAVKRIMAVKIANIKVGDSPSWLKDYLSLYEINSVNNLVDLTNFVMLETGHASHVFDVDKVGESLVWELNNGQYKNMTTLNGQELELGSDTLIISDGKRPLSLSFIGGQEDAVSNSTQNILLEMAVYNPTIVRRNARELKVITEASTRLEKFMDPDSIPEAFEWLISLITDNCGGSISSEIFDEYIQVTEKPEIKVDLNKVQEMAGISITPEESLEYLKNLGFIVIKKEGDIVFVNRPINRLDIEIEYDVFEEIIRMKGFNNIPSNHFTTQVVKDITPKRIKLMDRLSEILVNNGFDEVRSWILVDEKSNQNFNNSPWEPIKVSNSINEEVPFLRASIGVSLSGQIHNYRKNGVDPINLFEVGKTFGKKDGKYTEVNTLGVAIGNDDVNFLKNIIEITLRSVGLENIIFKLSKNSPVVSHPLSYWQISTNDTEIGSIYISNNDLLNSVVLSEINIDELERLINLNTSSSTVELTQKIVRLDTNINTSESEDINAVVIEKLKNYRENVWSWEIIDAYKSDSGIKHTIRVAYVKLSDQDAKELHSKIFSS